MFVRSCCWRAAVRPRHTWMALMVDECNVMPLDAITPFVQLSFTPSSTFHDSQKTRGKTSRQAPHSSSDTLTDTDATAEPSASSSTSKIAVSRAAAVSATASSAIDSSTVNTALAAAPGSAPAERAHAWVAVARLLSESGDWARAVAVVEGLPSALQQAARFKAIRDDWPLPRSVATAWRVGAAPKGKASGAASNFQASSTTPVRPEVLKGSPVANESDAKSAGSTASSAVSASSSRPRSYISCRTEELVRLAYSLRKVSPSPAQTSPSAQLQREQHNIIAELRRRGAVAEALQCIVNWQRRLLLRPDAETLRERAAAGAAGATAEDAQLYDGLGAVKALLFPGETSAAVSGTTSVFEGQGGNDKDVHRGSGGARRGGEPPRYTAQHLQRINEAAGAHPALVARCLRDRAVGDRLLRHAGEGVVASFVFQYLNAVAERGNKQRGKEMLGQTRAAAGAATVGGRGATATKAGTTPRSSPSLLLTPLTSSNSSLMDAAMLEVYWRTLAALLPLLHPYWHSQTKFEKEKLLVSLASALRSTVQASTATELKESHERMEAAKRLKMARMGEKEASEAPKRGLTDKCRRAIKASVESICSPLLHHEPQVRFLRLQTFATVAQHLVALNVAVPNALMQCLFLCMADTAAVANASTATAPRSATAKEEVSPAEIVNVSRRDSLEQFLTASPADRWLPALALLRAAHQQHDFRVTAAHPRALLSGLQSVSITKTWQAALSVVATCEAEFNAQPDERTLPTLLLNLKQQSWERAFRVLQYVPGKEPAAASPHILRDLQLVALKHASWEVPLRLMRPLQEQHADGFMNYLYSLCAASRGGQADVAFAYFCALRLGRGRHTAWRDVSPFNELTVAVAAVAMLDAARDEALHRFAEKVLAMDVVQGDDAHQLSVNTGHEFGASPAMSAVKLTLDGRLMAQAANLAALLNLKDYDAITSFLTALPNDDLPSVLRRYMALRCLLGMGHLHAPIRLIFDVLGHASSPPQQQAHRGFLRSVDAAQVAEGTYETRQRGTAARRKHLFIPMPHQRAQKLAAAVLLGAFVKVKEPELPPHVVHCIAESMVGEGVGAEYMTAALL